MSKIATNAQHKKVESHLVYLLDQVHRCDDRGFEVVTNDSVMMCRLMCNDTYRNTDKCREYAQSGSKSCLRCIKAPRLRTLKELKEDIALETKRRQRLNLLKEYKNVNWTTGHCPSCQPNGEGEPKSLLNGTCRPCLNIAKAARGEKRSYTRKASVYTPPPGFTLIKNCDIITKVHESAAKNKRVFDAELEILIERALVAKGPGIDFDKLKRLISRRKDIGTNQDSPAAAYKEAFDRVELLIGDIQAGDI